MKIIKYIAVNNYFSNKIKKIYCKDVYVSIPSQMSIVKGYGKLLPFNFGYLKKKLKYREWVKQSLGVCYEHSSSILLGLNPKDKCVIAKCDYDNNANFYHAWNEFEYKGEWFVFDCGDNCIYEKQHYYEVAKPTIIKEWTLQDVLTKYDKHKSIGKRYETINLKNLKQKEQHDESLDVPRVFGLTVNSLYSDAKIKLDKAGNVISAEVSGAEIG